MSKCANCNDLVGEEWSANNGLCTTCARDEVSKEEHEKELREVYDSGCSDTAKHFLALFEGELTEQMKKWLRLEIAERSKF